MRRSHLSALLGGLLAGVPVAVGAQQLVCTDGWPPRPSIGVDRYHCVGGACRIWGVTGEPVAETILSQEGGRAYWGERWEQVRSSFEFTVEPTLWDIDPAGPAAGRVQPGDALVAVAGIPVTSPQAGRILGDPPEGGPLPLTLRRDGSLVSVEVVPAPTCSATTLSMGTDESVGLRVATRGFDDAEPRGGTGSLLGLILRCEACRAVDTDEGRQPGRWRFEAYPTVAVVRGSGPAGIAGVLAGDRLTHVDGLDLLSEEGARRLSELRRGEEVEIRAERDGRTRTFSVRIPQ